MSVLIVVCIAIFAIFLQLRQYFDLFEYSLSTYAELIVYSVFLFPLPPFPFPNLNYQITFARLLTVYES